MDFYKEAGIGKTKSVNVLNDEISADNSINAEFIRITSELISEENKEKREIMLSLISFLSSNTVDIDNSYILNSLEETLFSIISTATDEGMSNITMRCILKISAQNPPLSSIVHTERIIFTLIEMLFSGNILAAKSIYNILLSDDEKSNEMILNSPKMISLHHFILEQNIDLAQIFVLLVREMVRRKEYSAEDINAIIEILPQLLNNEIISKTALSLLYVMLEKQKVDVKDIPEEIFVILNGFANSPCHHHAGIALNCIEVLYSKMIYLKEIDHSLLFDNLLCTASCSEYNVEKSIVIFTNFLSKNPEMVPKIVSPESIDRLIEIIDDKSAKVKEDICLLLSLIVNSLSRSDLLQLCSLFPKILYSFYEIIMQENEESVSKLLDSFYKVCEAAPNIEELLGEIEILFDISDVMEVCEDNNAQVFEQMNKLLPD